MGITTVPLQPRFLASLDKQHCRLIEIFRDKGGAFKETTRDILKALDQSLEVNLKRECLLKSLILYLGEDIDTVFKEYLVDETDKAEQELERYTMAAFVIREEKGLLQTSRDIGLVIEGVKVLSELSSLAHGCAILFGLIYALHLSYPKELKRTIEELQKILMEIEPKKMTRKVFNLSVKL